MTVFWVGVVVGLCFAVAVLGLITTWISTKTTVILPPPREYKSDTNNVVSLEEWKKKNQ